jgi:uncharacterized alkaline shock family protein YloU
MTPPAGGDAGFLMSQPGGNGASRAEPATSHGRTHIAETVVSKIAGLAAREASGVYALGGGAARAFGAIRERIPGASSNVSQGVAVEVGERQSAIDLDIVVEVNVSVNDVHLPSDDDGEEPPPSGPPPRGVSEMCLWR